MSRYLAIILISTVFFLQGCSPEKKLAKEYVGQPEMMPLMILSADFIYKSSLNEFEIEDAEIMTEEELDSALYYNSLFLKEINDSTFIARYLGAFIRELELLGFNVFREDQFNEFLELNKKGYTINLSQVSIEEYIHSYTADEVVLFEVVSVSGIDLNALNINTWFEFNSVNSDTADAKIFFSSDYIFDDLDGYFRSYLFSTDATYEFTIDTIKSENIYLFTEELGKVYAGFAYDYFLNIYLSGRLPESAGDESYYHYDREAGQIRLAGEFERFMELE